MIRGALLTLLSAGPKYGYQLKSEFEASTGAAWALNIGQVYSTLRRMERDDVIVALGEDDEGRPCYELSAAGREELANWMAQPVRRSVATRDEVTMKILMVAATGVVDIATPIAVQRAESMRVLQEATATRRGATNPADRLHLDWLIVNTNAELRWLDLAEEQLTGHRPHLGNVEAGRPEPPAGSAPAPVGGERMATESDLETGLNNDGVDV